MNLKESFEKKINKIHNFFDFVFNKDGSNSIYLILFLEFINSIFLYLFSLYYENRASRATKAIYK